MTDTLDAGARLAAYKAVLTALDRCNPRPQIEATCRPVPPRDPAQPSTNGRGNPQAPLDPNKETP